MAVHHRAHGPAQYETTDVGYAMHEGRRQTKRRPAYAGSRLKLTDAKPAFEPYSVRINPGEGEEM